MRRHSHRVTVAIAALLALSACSKARQVAEQPSGPGGCLGCHGGTNDLTGAPPRDLQGLTARSGQLGGGIGAHTTHLGRAVLCTECHQVPERIATPGHITRPDGSADNDGRAEITWGLRATNGGKFLAGYVAATNEHGGSCTVYCHAGTPGAAGTSPRPGWGDPAMTCGSCHGDGVNTSGVPGGAHPQNPTPAQCASCHPDTVDATGAIIPGGGHLNGQVDVKGCTTCHGDANRGETGNWAETAPPMKVGGSVTDPPTDPRVGAHLRHVSTIASRGSRLSLPFACTECHLMPYAAGPHNPPGGVVQFGNSLASGFGAVSPAYSGGSCATSYCHGATLAGGTNRTPSWPGVGSAACGSCHFIATPPAPHVARDKAGTAITTAAQCAQCHPGTVNAADGSVNIGNGLHVNGRIDVDFHAPTYSDPATHGPDALKNLNACKTCHGATLDGSGQAPSCTQCHAAAGHANWLTECTFCHGDGNRAGDAAFALVGTPAVRANLAGPPIGAQRELNSTDVAVGAHQAHINPASSSNPSGALSVQIQCTQCHGSVLPTDANHADGSVAIGWGNLATARASSASPSTIDLAWETNPTCTNYCHGSATVPGGGSKTTPRWTAGAVEAACGTCHGFRPGSWHPNNAACGSCHPGYTNATVNVATHVNGAIDPAATGCSSCHGGLSGNNAPPSATGGETSGVKVGAHQAHVNASVLVATGFACASCHVAPSSMRHANAQVDMAWSALAATNVIPTPTAGPLATASWEAAPTCTNYCHGASLTASGGSNRAPAWTAGASQVACGTCHAAPPPLSAAAGANHPQNVSCASCHGAGYSTGGITGAAKATHVNGAVNLVVGGCTACHGDRADLTVTLTNNLASSAPGEGAGATSGDTTGTNSISAPGVGAHVAHLSRTTYRSTVLACTECHGLPPSNADRTAHVSGVGTGGARATVAWGNLAKGTGAAFNNELVNPSYAGSTSAANGSTAGSCASTYCHGQFKNGAKATIGWTQVGGLTCNSCHGAGAGATATPPGGNHPANSACGSCHPGYSASGVNALAHMNGALEVSGMNCSSCHGDAARTPDATATWLDVSGNNLVKSAPPVDNAGLSVSSGVGAHLAHVNRQDAPGLSKAMACSNCHTVPSSAGPHVGAGPVVVWSGLSVMGGAAPAFNATNHTCASTYCHGQFSGGIPGNSVAWGTGALGKLACNACHANPPAHPHPQNLACASCHAGYSTTAVVAATHVDGLVTKSTSGCTACHGELPATGVTLTSNLAAAAPGATGTNTVDTTGQAVATAAGVGAHKAHLGAGAITHVAIACTECHALPPSNGDTSHATSGAGTGGARATLTWGATATRSVNAWAGTPVTPAYAGSSTGTGGTGGGTCASTYCHGNFTNGRNVTLGWTTVGAMTCNSCHGAGAGASATLPGGSHPQGNTVCSTCHTGYTNTTASATLHLNGRLDVSAQTCSGCHGDASRASVATATELDANSALLQQAAPPIGVTASNQVGAHLAHVNQGATAPAYSSALRCGNCHVVPGSGGHSDGVTTVAWGDLAIAGGAAPSYDAVGHSCSSTYCHGKFTGGLQANPIAWGNGTPSKLGCSACHGNGAAAQPPHPHPQNLTCAGCHAGYTATTVAAAVHVDGVTNKTTSGCTACHGELPLAGVTLTNALASAAPGATGTNTVETTGLTAITAAGVGVHRAHLVATNFRAVLACTECHALPPSNADTAHGNSGAGTGGARATLTWGNLAKGTGAAFNNEVVAPAYSGSSTGTGGTTGGSCASTYCHGQFKNGKKATVTWTAAGTLNCNSCHGAGAGATATLPGGNHPQGTTACGSCHSGYTVSAVNATVHLNGALEVLPMSCTSCHGDVARTPVASATVLDVNGQNLVRAAPPTDSLGAATGNLVGVHLAHVNQGATAPAWSNALRCDNCHSGMVWATAPHTTPANPIAWGNLANDGGAVTPTAYSVATKTCSNTYCHGNWPYGKGNVTVAWATAGKLSCTSCHGNGTAVQPPHPHPQNTTCASCHAGYTATTVAAASHVDGVTNKTTSGCTACHGDLAVAGATLTANTVAAAPGQTGGVNSMDTTGATATTAAGVGVHRVHLSSGAIRNALACTECHALPASNTDTAHGNSGAGTGGARATLAFGALATRSTNSWSGAPVVPAYTGSTTGTGGTTGGSCASTYCHGNFTNGAGAAPSWTAAGTITCNSCHGRTAGATASPPGGTHPNNASCGSCHTGYTGTSVNLAAHMNGLLDVVPQTCTSCHGDTARAPVATASDLDALGANLVKSAPPSDSVGLASGNQVGAHLAHVNQGATAPALSSALRCVNCHTGLVPAVAPHAPAANPVAFGNLATAAAAAPSAYAPANRNCTNTYCHGQFTGGKLNNTVNWGNGTLAKLACNACHGQSAAAPQPTYPHAQNTSCVTCHGTGYSSSTVAQVTHVNGAVTRTTSGCTGCHGELNFPGVTRAANLVKAAPGASGSGTNSYDTTGLASGNTIGAHKAHLVGSTGTPRWRSTAITCTECHALPPSDADISHSTGAGTGGARATIAFGNLATDTAFEVKAAAYTRYTCTNVYCHDPKSSDTAAGTTNLPAWNGAATQAQCGSCHGLPPVTAAHPANSACGSCHPGYANAPTSASTIAAVNQLSHLNGALEGGGDCTGCHASAQAITKGPAAGGTRRAITGEFRNTWSHKRSTSPAATNSIVVTKYDCGVCHLEGDAATGDATGVHQDGYVNLRDPDTGGQITSVTFSPASGNSVPGSYGPAAGNAVFGQFSRNLTVTLENDPNAATLQAIMVNQCLHCHDANGALSPLARVPVAQMPGVSQYKPFGTTIAGAGYVAGGDISAGNVAGGVVNVNESFKTTNSSYHPVSGKQNNWYAKLTRMAAPWNGATRGGSVDLTSWGPLISCWDCHADPTDTGTINHTVTAHGAPATLRGNATASGTGPTAATGATLCWICHAGYQTGSSSHGTGSALSGSTNGTMTPFLNYGCNRCHASNYTTAVARPVRAQDVHGVNALPAAGTKTGRWSTGADKRPWAFIRNTISLSNHQPARINGTTYGASCTHLADSPCNSRTESYTAGGTY